MFGISKQQWFAPWYCSYTMRVICHFFCAVAGCPRTTQVTCKLFPHGSQLLSCTLRYSRSFLCVKLQCQPLYQRVHHLANFQKRVQSKIYVSSQKKLVLVL